MFFVMYEGHILDLQEKTNKYSFLQFGQRTGAKPCVSVSGDGSLTHSKNIYLPY